MGSGTRVIVVSAGSLPGVLREWINAQGRSGRMGFELVGSMHAVFGCLEAERADAILCLEGERGLDLLRNLRARGEDTRFVLVAPEDIDGVLGQRAALLGDAVCLDRATLTAGELTRAIDGEGVRPAAAPKRNVDLAPVMLWRTNREGRFTDFNRRWYEFTGRSAEKEHGLGWLDNVHPADAEVWTTRFAEELRGEQEFVIDLRLRPEGRSYRWLRCHGVPVLNAEDEFSGYLGSSCDVTDLKQAERQAYGRNQELERTKRELEGFLQAACHDLLEPLRTLAMDLEGVEGEARSRALRSAERMELMLHDLLECAGISTSGEPMEPVELAKPLEWALSNLRALIEEVDARVTFEPLPVARGDGVQIARLFQNLIGNALKFRRGQPPEVHVGVTEAPDEWRISVQDNGPGIPADQHERIFRPFERLVPGQEGRGLGLTIARAIVEHHGGRLWLESEPDRGSTFHFTLPR